MSYLTKEGARRAGAVAERRIERRGTLRLDGVKLDVWENMGWHWALRHRDFGLYPLEDRSRRFHCLMAPDGRGVGRPRWVGNERDEDPSVLLQAALKRAKAELVMMQRCIRDVEALLKGGAKCQSAALTRRSVSFKRSSAPTVMR